MIKTTKLKAFSIVCIFGFSMFATQCKDKSSGNDSLFNRNQMLREYADQLIKPGFSEVLNKVGALKTAWIAFDATPDANNLSNLQTAWVTAYTAWQSANAFNFGPAAESGLKKGLVEEIGTFPVNTAKIEAYIANNDLSFNNFDRDTRGFIAAEFLIFNTDNGTLAGSTQRRAYLNAVINHLQTQLETVVLAWADYYSTFIAADGTDSGSSTSMLYNEFVRSFEAIKNFKVGLPAGKRPGQTQAEPQLVEALYSGQSLAMLKAHIASIERIYLGKSLSGTDGLGLKDYLDKVVGGPTLVESSAVQWQKVLSALAAVPSDQPLSILMQQNHPSIDVLHTELQKHTRFFKSDMSSLLGIAITFSSGDGD
jgi:predicted lipoprotein